MLFGYGVMIRFFFNYMSFVCFSLCIIVEGVVEIGEKESEGEKNVESRRGVFVNNFFFFICCYVDYVC